MQAIKLWLAATLRAWADSLDPPATTDDGGPPAQPPK